MGVFWLRRSAVAAIRYSGKAPRVRGEMMRHNGEKSRSHTTADDTPTTGNPDRQTDQTDCDIETVVLSDPILSERPKLHLLGIYREFIA